VRLPWTRRKAPWLTDGVLGTVHYRRFRLDEPFRDIAMTRAGDAMLVGVRAALAAVVGRPEARRYAWVTVVGITLGGLVFGPIVQKAAFGAYWTGWPLGTDLTDDKTAVMWLAWVVAVVVLARRKSAADPIPRATVILAAVVMVAVYLVPHSLRGSQRDYQRDYLIEGSGGRRSSS
jgi:hypothetical protein